MLAKSRNFVIYRSVILRRTLPWTLVSPLSARGVLKIFNVGKKGDLHFFEFLGGLSKNGGVNFVSGAGGGSPEDFLKVIFNC